MSAEPWMRGPLEGVEAFVQPVFFSFQQVREDLETHTSGLTTEQVWTQPAENLAPLGFHLRHIPGSIERLTTYLMDRTITPEQIAFLKAEATPGASLSELTSALHDALAACEAELRTIEPKEIHAPRFIGRKRLPTTVLGLLVHIAEHTQRHLGQAITTAKLVRG